MSKDKFVFLKRVRISFPDIFKQGTFEGKPSGWGAAFVLDPKTNKKEIAALEAKIAEVLQDDKLKNWKHTPDKICLKSAEYSQREEYGDCYSIRAGTRTPPVVFMPGTQEPIEIRDYENDGDIAAALKASKIYSGCYVDVKLTLWAQSKPAPIGKRVNAQLVALRFVGDGEAFDGGHISEEEAAEGFEVSDDDAFFADEEEDIAA